MILINLLPPETLLFNKQSHRLRLIDRISMAFFVVFVFFTSLTLVLRILQNTKLQTINGSLVQAQAKVADLKDKESYAVVLKQRLASIQKLTSGSKAVAVFNLISALVPADTSLSSFGIDKTGNIKLSAASPSADSLEVFINNLTNKEKNSDLVSKIDLDSLALGKDGSVRYGLKVTVK